MYFKYKRAGNRSEDWGLTYHDFSIYPWSTTTSSMYRVDVSVYSHCVQCWHTVNLFIKLFLQNYITTLLILDLNAFRVVIIVFGSISNEYQQHFGSSSFPQNNIS